MTDAAVDFVRAHPGHRGLHRVSRSPATRKAAPGTARCGSWRRWRARGEKIDWCVIGEPSCTERLGDTIRIGRRGSLSGIITVHGIEGHVAYPQLARNPIQQFAPVITELYAQPLDQGNEFFPPSSFQVVQDRGGRRRAECHPRQAHGALQYPLLDGLDLRAAAGSRRGHPEAPRSRLRAALAPVRRAVPDAAGGLVEGVAAAVEAVTGVRPELSTGGGTSDGRFIAPCGTHVVEFGAVNASIHKINEHVAVADIDVDEIASTARFSNACCARLSFRGGLPTAPAPCGASCSRRRTRRGRRR